MTGPGRVPAEHPLPAGFGISALLTVPRSVWAVTVLHVLLLLAWSLLVPIYHGAHEVEHVDLVRAAAGPEGWPAAGQRAVSLQVQASSAAAGAAGAGDAAEDSQEPLRAAEAVPRGRRPGFSELAPDEPSALANHLAGQPPLPYVAAAVPVMVLAALVPGGLAHDQAVWVMRLVGLLCVAPLPLLAFSATRRLTGTAGPAATAAAVLPLAIPQLTHVGSTVNNGTLLVLLMGLLTVALVFLATGDTSRRTALAVGVLGGAALLAGGFALSLPVWVGAAAVVAATRGAWRPALSSGAVAVVVAAAVGGWWWLHNLATSGVLQASLLEPVAGPGPASPPALAAFHRDRLIEQFWGAFGAGEAHLAWGMAAAAAWLLVAGVGLAFALRAPLARWRRADLVVALVPVVAVGAAVAYAGWRSYTSPGEELVWLPGPPLFTGVVGTAAAAAIGYALLARGLSRILPVVVLAGAAAAQAAGGATVLAHFWGTSDLRDAGGALLAWSPWPAGVAAAIGAGTVLAGVVCLAALVADARHLAAPARAGR